MSKTFIKPLLLLALLPAALRAQDDNGKPAMKEQLAIYTLTRVEKAETPDAGKNAGKNAFTLRYEVQSDDRYIKSCVARFTVRNDRYLVEERLESESYPYGNVGEPDETWHETVYPDDTAMLPRGYADGDLMYANVLMEYWKSNPMPEAAAAWITRLNWWAMRYPADTECYENSLAGNAGDGGAGDGSAGDGGAGNGGAGNGRPRDAAPSGETAGWVSQCRKMLEKRGVKAVWNRELKIYDI